MDRKEGTRHGNPAGIEDKHPELNAFLDDTRDAGMLVTKKWMDMWFTAVQYVWSQQLQGWKLKKNWQYIVVNRIYPLMFQTIAKLAGNNPKIMAHAWDDEKEGATEYAERWAGHFQYLWESPYELNMRLKLIKGLLDCAVFGYMVGKGQWEQRPVGGWNDTLKAWVGKPDEYFVHPARFWADPSAENLATAENCGTTRRVKLEWAQSRWPQYKDQIAKEAYGSSDPQYTVGDLLIYKDQKASTLSLSRQRMFSKLVELILNQGTATGSTAADLVSGDKQQWVDLEEIYWRDHSIKHVKIEDVIPEDVLVRNGTILKEDVTGIFLDPKTKKPIPTDKYPKQVIKEYDEPLYPQGRFVLRIGRTILNPNEQDQVYKESRWPFTVMPYHILPHMWQGGNAVEMARNNNDFLNITMSSMVQQVRRSASPTKVIEAGALAKGRDGKVRTKRDAITGLGRILVAARGKIEMIKNLEYPALDRSVALLAELLKKDIDAQEFMHPVARGEAEKGQQTKAEVVRLNQNALDYVGLQGIFLDKFIDDTMTLIAELCQRNYDPDRLMQVIGDDERKGVRVTKPMLDVELDVNIEPGSTLPFDEQKKQQEYAAAYKMLENPIPNPMIEEMLRVLNISKRREILSRYKGLQLFRQFIGIGQILMQLPPEQLQVLMAQKEIPELSQLVQLLIEAGQLAPQMGEPAGQAKKKGAA